MSEFLGCLNAKEHKQGMEYNGVEDTFLFGLQVASEASPMRQDARTRAV